MLTYLQVKNFTLVDALSLDLSSGLTVLTGETGAGKSILLDALHLALGDRADSDKIKAGTDQAEVSASFDVIHLPVVREWLQGAELGDQECIVRRIVTREGRSRAYINGQVVTLTQLRALGDLLLDLHSQHEHQSLLKVANHKRVLDAFGKQTDLAKRVGTAFKCWQGHQQTLAQVREASEELNARYQLLRYQVEELEQLNLSDGEVQSLEASQKQLENRVLTQQSCQQVLALCCEFDDSVVHVLAKAIQVIGGLPFKSKGIEEVESMLQNARIQVEEAGLELEREQDISDLDELNLPEIEQRLTAIYDISRKHRVAPEDLLQHHESLAEELTSLSSGDEQISELENAVAAAHREYTVLADELTEKRKKAASLLAKSVNKQLGRLAMAHAKFDVQLVNRSTPAQYGNESVEFLISTVPGQPAKALSKIASGGELSRISLSIQVVAAKTSVTPTLVFDEVDVGIGGTTGDVVGEMLRELGAAAQIICVTHLAQVASKAHQHLRVEKSVSKKSVSTRIQQLQGEDKVLEIARMMGGAVDSEQSLAHAREMLEAL